MQISYHPQASAAFSVADGWQKIEVCDMNFLAWIICGTAWSNLVWSGTRRRGEYFTGCYFCALDFDDGSYSLQEALTDWQDTICVIGTTKSHQKPKHGIVADRFRIVAPWDVPLKNLDHYKQNQNRLIRMYGADPACKGGAQFFFPCTEIKYINNSGYMVETKKYVRPKKYAAAKIGYVEPWIRALLDRDVVPPGKRNDTFFRVAINLIEAGWHEERVIMSILNSPTYKNKPEAAEKEIAATVRSAAITSRRSDPV